MIIVRSTTQILHPMFILILNIVIILIIIHGNTSKIFDIVNLSKSFPIKYLCYVVRVCLIFTTYMLQIQNGSHL